MKLNPTTQDQIKKAVGYKAAELVEDGMLVGLGTGTTARFFIQRLIERVEGGLSITAVSSSIRSTEQAKKGGIEVVDINQVTTIDITVDGADEIDPHDRMIKGGGGALVREKIVASSSKKMVVIIDESKLVDTLGKFGLPVEIIPFGHMATIHKLENLGYSGKLRMAEDKPYVTDNGNYIYDIHKPQAFPDPEKTHLEILRTAGVVDAGLFYGLPTQVLVGYHDGKVAFRSKA